MTTDVSPWFRRGEGPPTSGVSPTVLKKGKDSPRGIPQCSEQRLPTPRDHGRESVVRTGRRSWSLGREPDRFTFGQGARGSCRRTISATVGDDARISPISCSSIASDRLLAFVPSITPVSRAPSRINPGVNDGRPAPLPFDLGSLSACGG